MVLDLVGFHFTDAQLATVSNTQIITELYKCFEFFYFCADEEDYKKENLTNIARGQIIPEGWDILFAEGDQDIPYNNIDGLQVRCRA